MVITSVGSMIYGTGVIDRVLRNPGRFYNRIISVIANENSDKSDLLLADSDHLSALTEFYGKRNAYPADFSFICQE